MVNLRWTRSVRLSRFSHTSSSCTKPVWRRWSSTSNASLVISDEVREGVLSKQPIVALESAIYTHGFPYPENTALASHLESIVRINGGIPATVGVLNGVARVGFGAEELIELTSSAGNADTRKVSRRDLAYVMGKSRRGPKLNGGTTVSGTMVLAQMAGIHVFATGGLGGVHRGGETSLDISADLTELGRTRMAVISSGCKSFLDLPRTLEYLETQGVCVGTFADGRLGDVDLPAFWTRDSGVKSPMTLHDEEEAAAIVFEQAQMNLQSGLLLANPIPAEHSIAKAEMDAIISQAIQDADRAGISGSANTPFVLSQIRRLTEGRSVTANRALIEANVARATKVAVHLMKLYSDEEARTLHQSISQGHDLSRGSHNIYLTSVKRTPVKGTSPVAKPSLNAFDVIVAGSIALDISCDFSQANARTISVKPQAQTSNPALIKQNIGGVGHNVASALHHLDVPVHLCSVVADDLAGNTILSQLAERGLSSAGIRVSSEGMRTAQYVAVNDAQKDLVLAMADMSILESAGADFHSAWQPQVDVCKPKWLVVDANWSPSTLRDWLAAGRACGAKIAYEPVSVAKAKRIFTDQNPNESPLAVMPNNSLSLATPNALELASMYDAASAAGFFHREDWFSIIDSFGLPSSGSRTALVATTTASLVDRGIPQQALQLLPLIPCIITTLGADGVLLTEILHPQDSRLTSPDCAPYILTRSTDGNPYVGGVYMRLFPPVEIVPGEEIISVNGVGDTFLGCLIAGLVKSGSTRGIDGLIDVAQRGSVMTLKSAEAVSPEIATLRDAL